MDLLEFPYIFAGKSVAQVALKWLLQKDTVPAVIIGVNSLAQLEDNLGATGDWKLTDQQVSLYAYSGVAIHAVGYVCQRTGTERFVLCERFRPVKIVLSNECTVTKN